MKARDVNHLIEKLGGEMVRQVGSHRRYKVMYPDKEGETHTAFTTVAQHTGDIPIGTLKSIERQLEAAFGPGWLRGGK